jgi:hypothetical protein
MNVLEDKELRAWQRLVAMERDPEGYTLILYRMKVGNSVMIIAMLRTAFLMAAATTLLLMPVMAQVRPEQPNIYLSWPMTSGTAIWDVTDRKK